MQIGQPLDRARTGLVDDLHSACRYSAACISRRHDKHMYELRVHLRAHTLIPLRAIIQIVRPT